MSLLAAAPPCHLLDKTAVPPPQIKTEGSSREEREGSPSQVCVCVCVCVCERKRERGTSTALCGPDQRQGALT